MGEARNQPDVDRLRAALDAARDAIVVIDAEGRIAEINRAATDLTSIPAEEAIGTDLFALVRELGGDDEEQAAIRAALGGTPGAYLATRRTRSGNVLRAAVTLTPSPGGGATLMTRGLDEYRERGSRAARARLLTAAAKAMSTDLDLDSTLGAIADILVPEWASGFLVALVDELDRLDVVAFRHTNPEIREKAISLLPRSPGRALRGGMLERVMAGRQPLLFENLEQVPEALRQRVAALHIESAAMVPLVARDQLVGIMCMGTDDRSVRRLGADDLELLITLGDHAAQTVASARAEQRFQAAFEHAPIGIAIFGADGTMLDVNPSYCAIAGYPRETLLDSHGPDFTHPDDRGAEQRRMQWLIEGKVDEVSGEKRLVRPDGEIRWVQVRAAALKDGTFVAQAQDVTERRRFETELEHLASHDALTGLLNRRRFEESLEKALAHVRRHGDKAAVLTIDLDNFKHVNDSYGHAVGDELLRAVAGVLLSRVRATDQVGRLGGDEFGVILSRTDSDSAMAVAQSLVDAMREIRVTVGERAVRVTVSAGLRSLEAAEVRDAGDLLSEADMAMYDAKERGRDRVSVIRPGDLQPERVRERMRWSERIRDALEADAFVLYEQPIVRVSDGVADRSELLIRLPVGGTEPAEARRFLPVAERYGLVQAIDRWVVGRAVALLAERQAAGIDLTLEVNLSGDSISDPSVVDHILSTIRAAPIDPSQLIFEITETSAIGNLERARGLAEQLIELGCGFALDDFGAGFSSFAYLKHLPLGVIKIDGQFIVGLHESPADQVTVKAMVDIARGLGKETVAEFVEDAATLETLRRLGVDRAQGYHVGRPRPAAVRPEFGSFAPAPG